jgi:hypothetical protein
VSETRADPAFQTVPRGDFGSMIEIERYARRSSDFDEIISRTNEHFWDPVDPDYIRFDEPWDGREPLLPLDFVLELQSAVADRLDEGQKIAFANESCRWTVSNILHGEQGALNLSSSLVDMFVDPGAQEYAANQVREEARHVHGFTRYVDSRFGGVVYPPGQTLGNLLRDLVASEVVHEKIVGMQMLVDGLAMGAFATLHVKARDPLLRRLCQLTMTDEAFHHKFGKIWAHSTIARLPEERRNEVEDWAAQCFQLLLFNLVNPEQKRVIYPRFGLDWEWVRGAVMEAFTERERRRLMTQSTDVFRTLIKTLLKAGIVTERTRPIYAAWVDMNELAAEGDAMVGDDIAEEGIRTLREINATKKKVVRRISA